MRIFLATIVVALANCAQATLAEEFAQGEYVVKPGTYLKSIAIVNNQHKLSNEEIGSLVEFLDDETGFHVKSCSSAEIDPSKLKQSTQSEMVIIVRDAPGEAKMLIAPDDHWAIVNVTDLVEDLPGERAKQRFFVPRARKQIIKAFSMLCGGASSQFPSNIMNTATIRELDSVKEQIPLDMQNFYTQYLEKLGFKARELVPYEDACQEGWAKPPTNAVQTAIWNRVHEIPSEPIKIEFKK